MAEPRIRVFLRRAAGTDRRLPAATEVALDTKSLADGEHRLRIEAQDATGQIGTRRLNF